MKILYCAITTKYLGPTTYRGSRVKADAGDGHNITVSWLHNLNVEENHIRAAEALKTKMDWTGDLIGGSIDRGYAFVFVDNPTAPSQVEKSKSPATALRRITDLISLKRLRD